MPYKDPEKQRAAQLESYHRRKAKVAAQKKIWRKNNRKKIQSDWDKYRKDHPEKIWGIMCRYRERHRDEINRQRTMRRRNDHLLKLAMWNQNVAPEVRGIKQEN